MAPLQEFPDRTALMHAAADQIEAALRAGLEARGEAAAALSGGSTPEPAYAALAARDLDWSSITFGLVDERFAPPTEDASNEKMLRRALAPALAKGAKLAPLYANAPNAAAAAELAEPIYNVLRFDIAVLGMGGDAHTASWFPHNPSLAEALDPTSTRAVMALTAPGAAGSPERLTMTYAAVRESGRLMLLITGADKRVRLEQAFNERPAAAPIAAVLRGASEKLDILWSG
jgi:6-phosphogluconolactonase